MTQNPRHIHKQQENENNTVVMCIQKFLEKHKQWRDHVLVLEKEAVNQYDKSRPGERAALMNAMVVKDEDDNEDSLSASATVMLHSLQTESMNGQVGTLVEYLSHNDRFGVKLEGSGEEEVAIRACNLSLVMDSAINTEHHTLTTSTHQQTETADTYSEQQQRHELETALFCPGALFVGTIQIPGLSEDEGRKEYSMTIVADPIQDEMGQPTGILARHRAYDDEQFVWIHLDHNDDDDDDDDDGCGGDSFQATSLTIRYADGETQCQGKWNAIEGFFEGTVRQLIPTEDVDGTIYHSRDEVTHTFILSPSTARRPSGISMSGADVSGAVEAMQFDWKTDLLSAENLAIAKHRSRTYELSEKLVNMFHEIHTNIENNWSQLLLPPDNSLEQRLLSETYWKEFKIVSCLAVEKDCATLRRRAELLDSMTFASVRERKKAIADLKENKGFSRALIHAECDERAATVRSIGGVWGFAATHLSCVNRPTVHDIGEILKVSYRLGRNFDRFDSALRRAEERLTEEDIRQWVVPLAPVSKCRTSSNPDDTSDIPLCTICHSPLQEEDTQSGELIIRLPCSHGFHDVCVRRWLHHHTKCPVCRFNLQK